MDAAVEIAKIKEVQPEIIGAIENTPANAYLELALKTTGLRKRAFASLGEVMKKRDKLFEFTDNAPFAIASKADPAKIIMYSNIPRTIDPVTIAQHTYSMWSDGRKRKKIEEEERASTYATKREVTTLGKFLTKYSNLKALGYKDDQIRSFCEAISIENQPPMIITCEKPEDYYTMFQVKTGSCMEVGTAHWGNWSSVQLKTIAEETGMYMSALYHYMPWCKGAYVLVNGKPIARFMLYRTDLEKDFDTYGDVRGSSQNYAKVMDEWLERRGIKRATKTAATIAEFKVPGFHHEILEKEFGEKQSFCPMPNMDNQQKDFSITYCKETDEFTVYPSHTNKGKRITDTYDWRGFVPSGKVPAT